MVPAFHSFDWLVTRSQARKSSCTGKSSISPPDGRLQTDAMELFPAYVGLHIAHALTTLPLILLECTCMTSEFDFPSNNIHPTKHFCRWKVLEFKLLSPQDQFTGVPQTLKVNQNGCNDCLVFGGAQGEKIHFVKKIPRFIAIYFRAILIKVYL